MPAYDNNAVAAKLDLYADLLELSGADKYRFLSYRKAASSLRAWPEQVAVLANEGRLAEVQGVGPKMADVIEAVIATGTFAALDAAQEQLPASLTMVMRVPGVGPKRAAQLHDRLGVTDLDSLTRALADGSVERLGGFGAKSAAKIAEGVDTFRRHRERLPIGVALPIAEYLCAAISALPGVGEVAIAGSVRRRDDTVGGIDLVVAADQPDAASAAIAQMPAVETVEESEADRLRITVQHGRFTEQGVSADIRIVDPPAFGTALRYFTGNVAHNVALAHRAEEVGIDIDRPWVREDDIYAALGLSTPPPEIRWGDGAEFSADVGSLITAADIRGDLQSHSVHTDGKNTLAENRAVAAELGYEYFAATDHAYALRMVGGLDIEAIERQFAEIDELNELPGPRILKGIELNIAEDGSLDYDDEVLARFDIALASLHSGWDQDAETVTRRLLAAIHHPLVDVIAHPTGRVIGRRDALRLDIEAVLRAAGETGTIMEINSYPDRLDLCAEHIRLARTYGVRFSLGTDAHAADQMRYMPFGVSQARRGLVMANELLNAQSWETGRTWLKRYGYAP